MSLRCCICKKEIKRDYGAIPGEKGEPLIVCQKCYDKHKEEQDGKEQQVNRDAVQVRKG